MGMWLCTGIGRPDRAALVRSYAGHVLPLAGLGSRAHRKWPYLLGRLPRAARACRKKKTPTTLRTTKSIIRCGSGTRRSSEMTRAQRVQSGAT